jgi:glycosyltransferase involved in cell wall biosynthesis
MSIFYTPLVSVIVTTYRREVFLKKTIVSIIQQTYKKLEVVIVNDENHHSIKDLIDSFEDGRIKLVEIPHAGRPAIPRNVGIANSCGELLSFCDDDDIFLPNKIELQVNVFARNPDIGLCYTDFNLIDEKEKLTCCSTLGTYNNSFEKQLRKNNITFSTIMVSRKALRGNKGFDERAILRASEDYLFVMDIIYNNPFFYISNALVNYRIHKKGISNWNNSIKKITFYYVRIVICMYTFLAERKISFSTFMYLVLFHLKSVLKQILYHHYIQLKKFWRGYSE